MPPWGRMAQADSRCSSRTARVWHLSPAWCPPPLRRRFRIRVSSRAPCPWAMRSRSCFPTNFPDEFFWMRATSDMGGIGGNANNRAVLVLALEGAFAGAVAPGQQIVFARFRLRVDGLQAGQTYKVIYPYGEQSFQAVATPQSKRHDQRHRRPGLPGRSVWHVRWRADVDERGAIPAMGPQRGVPRRLRASSGIPPSRTPSPEALSRTTTSSVSKAPTSAGPAAISSRRICSRSSARSSTASRRRRSP